MLSKLTRSLWFRLLAIFVGLAFLFTYGVTQALSYIYRADNLRELVSAHLALHVDYVLDDIGDPPRIERAMAIAERVPVDIRLAGPGLSWASDDALPRDQPADIRRQRVLRRRGRLARAAAERGFRAHQQPRLFETTARRLRHRRLYPENGRREAHG